MRVLFDKNVPIPLRQSLKHHQIRTAEEQGWATLSNGELIAKAEKAGFDLLLTCDQNVSYQQNLSRRQRSLVVLGSNIWPSVQSKLADIVSVSAVDRAQPRSFEFVEIPVLRRRR